MKQKRNEVRSGRTERWIGTAVTLLLALSVALCLFVVTQVLSKGYVSFGGFMLFRVVTGSMEPAIPVGSLLVSERVDIATVEIGDIVCFRTQELEIWGKIVTHRVVDILSDTGAGLLLETKGDANLVMDDNYVSQDNLIGKVIWISGGESPLVSVISFFTSKIGFLACIVFPCLLFAGMILRDCVSNIRKELQVYTEEVERLQRAAPQSQAACYGLTQEEYDEMVARIRAEVMEELLQLAELLKE